VKRKIESLPGVKEATVNIVWDPPWTPEMMSEVAKKQFGWGI
jgi:metal-sulfur cluster biosynthetic enzyme